MTSGIAVIVFKLVAMVNAGISLVIGLAVLMFLWGVFKLLVSNKDSKERAEAKGYIIWGIIALAVMVSVWGLVNLVMSTFGLSDRNPISAPMFPRVMGI